MAHFKVLLSLATNIVVAMALTATCSQPRPSNLPAPADLKTLAAAGISDACQRFSGAHGGFLSIPNQGYVYFGSNDITTSTNATTCQAAFNQIIDECITSQKFFGGEVFTDQQLFNLTNARGTLNPITSGSGAPQNPSTTVITTPSPPPWPGKGSPNPVGSPSFQNVTCGFGDVGNAGADGPTRWDQSDADDALGVFNAGWTNGTLANGLTYVRALSSFWNGPENWDCGVLENPCSAGVQNCGDLNTKGPNGHTIQNPAAWLIMNSFSNIHNFYFNQYLSFIDAKSSISSDIHDFATTFSPVPPDDESVLKEILDGLSLVYGQLAAFTWNKVLKDINLFKGSEAAKNNHGWSKDSTNNIVGGMITLGKDLIPAAKTQIEAENDLTSVLGAIVDQFESTTAQYVENLFGGTSDDINNLTSLISSGKWIDPAITNSTFVDLNDMKGMLEQILYAQLMPVAWNDVGGLHPVIVMDDQICAPNPPIATLAARYIPQDQQNSVGVCYNNIGFYLLSVNDATIPGPPEKPPPGSPRIDIATNATNNAANTTDAAVRTTDNAANNTNSRRSPSFAPDLQPRRQIPPDGDPIIFDILPGADKSNLNGQNWANITIDDLVISSYGAWVLNGNKNGYVLPDDSMILDQTGATGDTIFQNGIQTPGVFAMPLCTIDQAITNWRNHWSDKSKPQFYPCNS